MTFSSPNPSAHLVDDMRKDVCVRKGMPMWQRLFLGAASIFVVVGLSVQAPLATADDTPMTSAEAKARIEQLQTEQDNITAQYNAENEKLQRLMGQNEAKRADIASLETKINNLRQSLGQVALANFKAGGTSQTTQLMTAQDPAKFLTSLSQADKVGTQVSDQLRALQNEQGQLTEMQRSLQADQNASQASRDRLAELDKQAKDKLTAAQKLYGQLNANDLAKIAERDRQRAALASTTRTTPSTMNIASQEKTTYSGGPSRYPQPHITNSGNAYDWGNCTYWVFIRREQIGRPIGSYWGNAAQWPASAAAAGFVVDSTPEVGAAYVTFGGYYGHVMFVEALHGDGTMTISEMNWNWMTGVVTERRIPAVGTFIH